MRYFEALSHAKHILDLTFQHMEQNGWPMGGGSYLMNGRTLEYNKESFAKQELLYEAAKSIGGEARILEVGVYAAHSYLIMSLATNAKFDLVDPCNYGFEEKCIEEVMDHFKNYTKLHKGRSNEILQTLDWPYDLIHIDGGHGMEDVLFDFEHAKRLSYEKTLVVVDDWDGIEPQLPQSVKDTFNVIKVADCPNPNALIKFK